MAIKNTLKGGTDWTEEALKPTVDLNPTFDAFYIKAYGDNTTSTNTGNTTETDLNTITITQNDFNSSASAVINASVWINNGTNGVTNATFKLYVNGFVVDTRVISTNSNGSVINDTYAGGFVHFATGLDSTAGNIIVKITAQLSNSSDTAHCDGLTVQGINNNS